jgi:hypothetical protein
MIDTVVIGDRMFSLPIQVEGQEVNLDREELMDLDNGHGGVPHGDDNNGTEANDMQPPNEKEKKNNLEGASQSGNPSEKGNQAVDQTESKASKHGYVHDMATTEYFCQEVMHHDVCGCSQQVLIDVPDFLTGNASNPQQEAQGLHIDRSNPYSECVSSLSIVEKKVVKSVTNLYKVEGDNDIAVAVQELDTIVSTPVKRSKRRENSVDEDSSTRAERLKAKRNLDSQGMYASKSFLSFSDDKILSSITSLGISLGNKVDKGLENIKRLEHNRLIDASKDKTTFDKEGSSDEEVASETDSDMGFDQNAINHLIGDIADDIFGEHGSQVYDFKPTQGVGK